MREKTRTRHDGVKANEGIARKDALRFGPRENEITPRLIPRGLEVLIKKAAVDPTFKKFFLEKRADAATAIGLKLTAGEAAMLAAVPLPHLEGIIARTRVSPRLRPAFLGYAAAVMLAALGATTSACDGPFDATFGSRPEPPPKTPPWVVDDNDDGTVQRQEVDGSVARGIRPGRP